MKPAKPHTDREFESELTGVREKLLRMAGCVEQMISNSSRALVEGDMDLAQETILADEKVDSLEVETDELCLLMLAKRQPLASDLRMITTAMKMVTDLERIGDLAVNISERAMTLGSAPRPAAANKLLHMAGRAGDMVNRAIDSFIKLDVPTARSVFQMDNEVDDLYREINRDLQAVMHNEPTYVHRGVHLGAVAKFIERIADHGTNLAEQVIFLVDGRDVRHKPSRFAGNQD